MAPWVIRNRVELGCVTITTDGRALWKANNVNTYRILARGQWLDQVPDVAQRPAAPLPPPFWMTPEEAGDSTARTTASSTCPSAPSRDYEHLVFQFWEHHPAEKAKLMAQATWMMWNPRVGIEGAQEAGVDSLRHWAEPLYTLPLFLLAIAGLFFVPFKCGRWRVIFLLYETAAAWVFAGTTRYRVPWDFVLALLAAAALDRLGTGRSRRGAASRLRRPSRLTVRGDRLVDERRHPLRVLLGRRRPLRRRCGRAVTEASGEIAVGEHALERRRQRLGVSGRDEQAVDPVLDDVRDAACAWRRSRPGRGRTTRSRSAAAPRTRTEARAREPRRPPPRARAARGAGPTHPMPSATRPSTSADSVPLPTRWSSAPGTRAATRRHAAASPSRFL